MIDSSGSGVSGQPKTRAFMGLELLIDSNVLVPREETELLGRVAVSACTARPSPQPLRIIDMCCGAGNLACGIAAALPQATVWACDLTAQSVVLARRNVERLGLESRVRVFQGDLFEAVAGEALAGTIDLIVCNPPYISSGRLEQRSDLKDEPREAFDGGPYGLSIHQRVLKEGAPYLMPGGWLMFEFGVGQARQLQLLFERSRSYESFGLVQDHTGTPRVAVGQRKAELG